jgi:hypothetical protein
MPNNDVKDLSETDSLIAKINGQQDLAFDRLGDVRTMLRPVLYSGPGKVGEGSASDRPLMLTPLNEMLHKLLDRQEAMAQVIADLREDIRL